MAPELHKRVLAVLGFGNQRQIGLIIDKGTKALSKNRVIIGGRYADRSGGDVCSCFFVLGIPSRDSIPRIAVQGSPGKGRRRPPRWRNSGNNFANPPPPLRGVRP